MASLNLSTNGPSISKSYQSVVNAPPPTGAAASSPTYGQWAIFSVSAPLANAFQDSGNKESVLKVQSTGEGEIVDLIDEFSDGRVQFAFLKLKDSNTGLPKNVLIAWCGEGVPERTKGYFTSHMTAVAKLLHGYHVQITARSDWDLTPESIIRKVADASGSKYSSNDAPPPVAAATKPAVASKPAFTPTQSSGVPIRSARRSDANVDEDGWGADAPPVVRTQLEKVQSAYQPTKVNMRDLTSQKPPTSSFNAPSASDDRPDVVRGAYQPIGKVDIAEIRRQGKGSGQPKDDRPEIVKGSYEPVGKVDIAAIRARAQQPESSSTPEPTAPEPEPQQDDQPSLAQRSAAFSQASPLTSMPKPKVVNKFGGSSAFTGTKAPTPGGFESKPAAPAAPVGSASRTFADQGGKTPAQIWAEKKARERGASGSGSAIPSSAYTGATPIAEQKSGNTGWESGYAGKKWGSVETNKTGRSSIAEQRTGEPQAEEEEAPSTPASGISSIRDRFSGAAPMGAPAPSSFDRAPPPAPEPETSTKPNRGIPIPGLPATQQRQEQEEEEEEEEEEERPSASGIPPPPAVPRSPTPETPERESSPIRVANPVSKSHPVQDAHEEVTSPPSAMPTQSLGRITSGPQQDEDDEPENGPDPGRFASQAAAASGLGGAPEAPPSPAADGAETDNGERARAEYDYEAQEDNEVSFTEGEILTDIQKIDPDWWVVTNSKGQQGLVPANYLQILEEDDHVPASTQPAANQAPTAPVAEHNTNPAQNQGKRAKAMYDYEAGEDNEISFPEDAIITSVEFPDDDWWQGEYKGKVGLFPAAYVELQS
ncbi:actin binding protein [Exophiala xenobiotica]|uniref:Actin binding protein n=1 Tax=Lithohypha guttulata TaxID=1690604 RepID=A0ABR0JYR0_9EURO|nr:actin binding protein [Lithohypha guttulata]KAK5311263.1 actin binding protein [Exophiala xenobiotica]